MVVFSDYECPSCKLLAQRLDSLKGAYGTRLRIIERHFPLEQIHGAARDAAMAAECAAAQHRFSEMHRALFVAQGDLRNRPWPALARDAGVPDSARFAACMRSRAGETAIESDMAAGERLGVRGTPTLLIAGQRVDGAPPLRQLDSLLRRAGGRQ